jgi:hypothetical protein
MAEKIHCNKCGRTVFRDLEQIHGCGCDPDAPTWIAIRPDGRILALSHASYEIIE